MKTRTLILFGLTGLGMLAFILLAPIIWATLTIPDRCESYANWLVQENRAQRAERWATDNLFNVPIKRSDVTFASGHFGSRWKMVALEYDAQGLGSPSHKGGQINLIELPQSQHTEDEPLRYDGALLWISNRMGIAVMKPGKPTYRSAKWQEQIIAVNETVSLFCIVD